MIRLLSGQIARTVTTLTAGLRVSTLKPSTPVAHPQASPSCRSTVLLDREDAMGTTELLLRRLEKQLRPIARERIARGRMLREAPTRFWGGFGTGHARCATSRFSPTRSNTKPSPSGQLCKRFGFTESAITHGNLSVTA